MNYAWFQGQPDSGGNPTNKGQVRNVSIQDGRSELFSAGASFTQRPDATFVHVGAARSFIKRTGFGMGGKFWFNNDTHRSGQDMTFSISGVPADWIQTAFIADNLIQQEEGKLHGLYREFTLGLKGNVMGIFLVYFDPHLAPDVPNGNTFGEEAGLEFVIMKDFFLRLGEFRNSQIPYTAERGRGYGTGLGWVGPRMSFDYSLERVMDPTMLTVHTFGATLYF
jgi:hypothetical protein